VFSVNALIIVPSPLRGRAITSHLVVVLWQPSGMASCSIRERVKIEATLSPTLSHKWERRVFR